MRRMYICFYDYRHKQVQSYQVSKQAQDPREPVVQMKTDGSLLEFSLAQGDEAFCFIQA